MSTVGHPRAGYPEQARIPPRNERERALLALIHEGYKMPPARSQLIAKIAELRNERNAGAGEASAKARSG